MQTTFNEFDNEFRSVMTALSTRLKDSAWTIVYKGLIVIHYLIREGKNGVALEYLSHNARMLEIRNSSVLTNPQAVALGRYAKYLYVRAIQFGRTNFDYIRLGRKNEGRLRELSVDKGLLRECESVAKQLDALLKCSFHEEDINNDIILTAFRLLVSDLLSLYQVFNEGVINLLEHYFEMSKTDAIHALEVYEEFTRLTTRVVSFLKVAKHLEHMTKLRVPNIKHAPTSLTKSLEDYLNDPDFEINHRQYLAEKESKSMGKSRQPQSPHTQSVQQSQSGQSHQQPQQQQQQRQQQQPDLIDLLSGGVPVQEQIFANNVQPQVQPQATGYNPFLQQGQQVQQVQQANPAQQQFDMQMAQQQQLQQQQLQQQQLQQQQLQQQQLQQQQFQQQPQFQQQQPQFQQGQFQPQVQQQPQFNPLQQQTTGPSQQQQLTQSFTGAGFGGYSATPQVGQQQQQQPQQQPQPLQQSNTGGSNPFRRSLSQTPTGGNPFKRTSTLPMVMESSAFNSGGAASNNGPALIGNSTGSSSSGAAGSGLRRSNTNPFARHNTGSTTPLSAQSTGGNPFRKSIAAPSQLQQQQQQQLPQQQQQPLQPQFTFGGLEQLPTVSVFPQTQAQRQNVI